MSVAPRSRRLNSVSLPRFRSQPIQPPCAGFQTPPAVEQEEQRRAARRHSAGSARRCRRGRPARSASSSGRCSVGGVGEVGQQGEAQLRVGIGEVVDLQPLDERRRRRPRLVSSVGMTTNVAQSAGMPSLKSSFGSVFGGTTMVTRWLTSPTASSDAGSTPDDDRQTIHQAPARRCRHAPDQDTPAPAAVDERDQPPK